MIASGTDIESVEILLVEDNPVDVLITKKAFSSGRICGNLHVAEDGEEAMNFLYKRGKYSSAPLPDMILLDLNLPRRMGGRYWLRSKEIRPYGPFPLSS